MVLDVNKGMVNQNSQILKATTKLESAQQKNGEN